MFASDLRRKFGLDVVNAKGRRARVRHDERAWVDEGAARGHGGAAVEEGDAVECGEGRDGGGAGHGAAAGQRCASIRVFDFPLLLLRVEVYL